VGSTSSSVLKCKKKNTCSTSFLPSLLPGSTVVLLKIQRGKAGVRPEERLSRSFVLQKPGEVGFFLLSYPQNIVHKSFSWSLLGPIFSSGMSRLTVIAGRDLSLQAGMCSSQCSHLTIKTNLLMLESLSSCSEIFMLLIKFMVHMTSVGNNNGDLLPSSHSVDICNLYTAGSSV